MKSKLTWKSWGLFFVLISLLLFLLITQPALAQAISIPDGDVPALVAAIESANAAGGTHLIELAPGGFYDLTSPYDSENGLPPIARGVDLTINGNGAFIRRQPGAAQFRIFYVQNGWGGVPEAVLTLNDMMIVGGSIDSNGGGIHCDGVLNLQNVTVLGNWAVNRGGIDAEHCSYLTIENSIIHGNTADWHAGGLYFGGTSAVIMSSRISSNHAVHGAAGGIHAERGEVTIQNTTISDNTAVESGGGIRNVFSQLTISNSQFVSNSAANFGGAIDNGCLLQVNATLFENNRVTSSIGEGGALYNRQHETYCPSWSSISISQLRSNQSNFRAGAILVFGPGLALFDTIIQGNTSVGDGGGIYASGPVYLSGVTLSNNSSGSNGGGIYNENRWMHLVNSTISGNLAAGNGGGIYLYAPSDSLSLSHVTMGWNEAVIGSAIYHKRGLVKVKNTVIFSEAGNSCASETWWWEPWQVFGANLASDSTCPGFTTANPLLAALDDNGGPTPTHDLLPGSPAIDSAPDCVALDGVDLVKDQRGMPRPTDGDFDGIAACDLGALEVQPPEMTLLASLTHNWVRMEQVDPEATLSLAVYDSQGGNLVYQDVSWTFDPINGWWYDINVFGIDLVPGMFISVSDGVTTKTLELALLGLTNFDHANDTISGIAAPGQEVSVEADGFFDYPITGGDGRWTANFAEDLGENAPIEARIYDSDGDITLVETPWILANEISDHLSATSFSPNQPIHFEVLEGDGETLLAGPFTAYTDSSGHASMDLWAEGVDIQAGQVIRVTDGSTGFSKTLRVVRHTLGEVDLETDRVRGFAPVGSLMTLHVVHDGLHHIFHPVPDENGYWEYDLAAEGLDISAYTWLDAWVVEPDGDVSADDMAHFSASLRDSWISGNSFTQDSPVSVQFYAAPGVSTPIEFGALTDSNGNFSINRNEHGQYFMPGNLLVITDDATGFQKDLVLAPVVIENFDRDAKYAEGTAPAGMWMTAALQDPFCHLELGEAGTDGQWLADFTGCEALTPTSYVDAHGSDGDWDETVAQFPPRQQVEAAPAHNWIGVNGFNPSSDINLSVYDSLGGNLILETTLTTDENGWAGLDGWSLDPVLDVHPGQYIVAVEPSTGVIKDLIVEDHTMHTLEVTGGDFIARGQAFPNRIVIVTLDGENFHADATVFSDESGAWTANLGPAGGVEQVWANAQLPDEDGDFSRDPLANIFAALERNFIFGNAFPLNSTVQIELYASASDYPAGELCMNRTVFTDSDGNFDLPTEEMVSCILEPGMLVAAYPAGQPENAKLLVVAGNLSVDTVDYDLGVVSGSSPEEGKVQVILDWPGGWENLWIVTDGGMWEAFFGHVIDPQANIQADWFDLDQDATKVFYNTAPWIDPIQGPFAPVQVNTMVSLSAAFGDPDVTDTHTATWDWGDGSSSAAATINESYGFGTAYGEHAYSVPGVYTVLLTLSDDEDGTSTSVFQYVVVYDPLGGFVTGGGWIMSPQGAYAANPTLTGKATFGFVSKYLKGANKPTGNTEFQFKVANLNFKSTSYDWLVVAGSKAIFKGVGTINGSGNYGFLLSAIDADLKGSGSDTFRIKIWDLATGEIVYDNLVNAPDDADPTTQLASGNIVIHKPK